MTDATTSELLDVLEKEKTKLRDALPTLERERDEAWEKLKAAAEAQSDAWSLVVKRSGRHGKMDDVPDDVKKDAAKADRTYTMADTAFTGYDVRLRKAVARLKELDSPEALERLREKRSGLGELREKKRATAKATARDQGFPEVYLAETGNFKSGYDSKAKSDLQHFLNRKPKPDALHKFRSADLAWKLVEARGWEKYMRPAKPTAKKKAA